eukprot:TRINITY_DN3857_c0_g1_i11.p1 TRINITY_DN3857_c0_g1~~TRINITY_DN3857_c0_g1_i11.p1  ORF type:complete len:223 (+),score=58.67 TRINITY_DN3857_c0_g1_i11:23-670(+)
MCIRDRYQRRVHGHKLRLPTLWKPSVITMQTQKEVVLEESFDKALLLCKNQYEVVQYMPLIGHALFIKRCDGSQINPWMIQVESIAKHHKVVDSISLIEQGNTLRLKTGNDDEEVVNAVLPLFDDKGDADLAPFITSKLYHALMTFNVMQNIDTLFENAYLALMAAAQYHLVCQPASAWRDHMIELIGKTFNLTYANSKSSINYLHALLGEIGLP